MQGFGGIGNQTKINLLWLVSLVSAAPLYAADVPANTPLAPQQVFRYNNHSDPGTLDPQKVEENTAAQIVLDQSALNGGVLLKM